MSITAPQVIFILFGALMLISSVGVIYSRNQVNAAMSLVATFFFLAAEYVLLYAHTLAVLQILVYAGAIVVLFLFVIMLLSLTDPEPQPFVFTPMRLLSVVAVAVLAATAVRASSDNGVHAKVTHINQNEGGATVEFSNTPFTASPYALGALGEVVTAAGVSIPVMSVATGDSPRHTVQSASALHEGDEVTLRWNLTRLDPRYGTVREMGQLLFSRYLLPFEVTSLLLLVAIVGAVVVAKGKI